VAAVLELRADCAHCVGLCCVAPAFAKSADFAVDKAAGTPCGNLQTDFRCGIHADLRTKGFPGCTVFDCLGAGQRVTRAFAGHDWRTPGVAEPMFAAFAVARQVHELLWYLDEARVRAPHPELDDVWTTLLADDFPSADLDPTRARVGELLGRASEHIRGADGADHSRADLVGVRWRGADLHTATLRGALLLGADLRGADLRRVDLLGADLRGANICGADLSTSLFVTPMQVAAAAGDAATRLPDRVPRPGHWVV
jgi:uncharacterized protein YjbI with pentapeptide repeats